jgi:hypothetical protein
MNLPIVEKDKEDFYRFYENEISYPIATTTSTDIVESRVADSLSKIGKKIFSNLLIIAGGWFLFVSSALLSYNFLFQAAPTMAKPERQVVYFVGGLILLFLSIGKIKRKNGLLLYAIIPLIGFALSFLYNLIPTDRLAGDTFANLLMLSFLPVLFVFYYIQSFLNRSTE